MRRRAFRHVLVLAVLGAPLAAAVPHGKLAAAPAPTRVLAVRAAGIEVALDHTSRQQLAVRRVSHRLAPAQRRVVHVVRARAASARVAARPATAQASRTLTHDLVLVWPAQGEITTPFVPSGGSSRHDGIDIGSLRSLTVVAARGGRVIHVGYTTGFEGYGQIVDVEVAPGIETLYAHLAAMDVRVGQSVRTGETLGTAGCTGKCYGTHLHFEVRVHGTPVNPLPLLGG